MISLFSYELANDHLLLLAAVGVLIGMSKTGVHGASMLAVPLMAVVFGGRISSGIMLPILIMADFFGVSYYRRHADYSHLRRLFPWALVGVLLGTLIGKSIPDEDFRMLMGVIIFLSLLVMIWMQYGLKEFVPNFWWFSALMGLLCGFTTMVGNLAGSAAALYLLAMRLPKNGFIGTAAWFFLGVNLFKVPLHIIFWETIDLNSFLLDLTTLPFVAIGAFIGIRLMSRVSEELFRWFVILMTLVAAVFMIL